MLSVDTNILLYALNEDSPRHQAAYDWLASIQKLEEVAISEFILTELYCLLRNPAVLQYPLAADAAAQVVQTYRAHPPLAFDRLPNGKSPTPRCLVVEGQLNELRLSSYLRYSLGPHLDCARCHRVRDGEYEGFRGYGFSAAVESTARVTVHGGKGFGTRGHRSRFGFFN